MLNHNTVILFQTATGIALLTVGVVIARLGTRLMVPGPIKSSAARSLTLMGTLCAAVGLGLLLGIS